MDREQLLTMDCNMLLSIVNMKLRNNYDSLKSFCDDFAVDEFLICERLKSIGYVYHKKINQFIRTE
ncbi:MAG TPA: DUF4250 domain-containing protein [Haloplasmataceae bacterium]